MRLAPARIAAERIPWAFRSKRQYAPNIGWLEGIFAVVLVVIVGWVVYPNPFTKSSHGLLTFAAVSVWVSMFQFRRTSGVGRPAVREAFETTDEGYKFGFKNFGPGAALYLQARIEYEGEPVVEFKPEDPPLHLEEGEFKGLLSGPDSETSTTDTTNILNDDFNYDPEDTVDLHFSYVSTSGTREPILSTVLPDKESDCILEDLSEEYDDLGVTPRRVSVDRLRGELRENVSA